MTREKVLSLSLSPGLCRPRWNTALRSFDRITAFRRLNVTVSHSKWTSEEEAGNERKEKLELILQRLKRMPSSVCCSRVHEMTGLPAANQRGHGQAQASSSCPDVE